MRRITSPLFAAFLAISCAGAAQAEAGKGSAAPRDPEHSREMIEQLYKLEQAFVVCDDVRVSGADLIRLDDAIHDIEQTSGIPATELDSIYEQVETLAANDPAGFCSGLGDPTASIKTVSAEQPR